jgi:tetratricopeptide (TPR) repeat protein
VSRLHLYRGELADAEKHLERSLELCQLFGLRSLLAEVFEAYGNFYRESGDMPHAEEYYERSLKAYEDAEVDIATRELNEERARFYLLQGDTKRARSLINKADRQRETQGNTLGLNTARLCLAADRSRRKQNRRLVRTHSSPGRPVPRRKSLLRRMPRVDANGRGVVRS